MKIKTEKEVVQRKIESYQDGWIVKVVIGNFTRYLGWFRDLRFAYLAMKFDVKKD